jgi:chemotaxis protein methyltransferase CheR
MSTLLEGLPAQNPPGTEAPLPAEAVDTVIENLCRRVEQTLGIKAAGDALEKMKEYLERRYGKNCFDSPYFYERILSSPDDIFTAARFLTINETYFFREEAYFELLQKKLLPHFSHLNRPLRVCSAATSIGCEAYSLAMSLNDYCRAAPLSFEIDAFDINPEAIETAKNGRYTGNSLRDDGSRWKFLLDRYTVAEGTDFVIDPALQAQVRFYTHNILNGLEGNRYDLIFFRNALIYFSADKRTKVIDHLANALFDGGFLIMGVSETPAVNHPLLASQYALDTFYFRKVPKMSGGAGFKDAKIRQNPSKKAGCREEAGRSPPYTESACDDSSHDESPLQPEIPQRSRENTVISRAEPAGIAALIDDHEGGRPIAGKMPELLRGLAERTLHCGDELFAAVIYLLDQEDFAGADKLLAFIENHPVPRSESSAFGHFLRGEYHYFNNRKREAEASYREAAGQNGAFWPAFYRLCALAADGNPTQYGYKIRKALESVNQGKDMGYEIFIGGFSPDYYRQALERRLD